MSRATINWLAAALIALAMSCAWMLDGPSEIEAAQDVAADVQDAKAQAAAQRLAVMRATQAGYQP